ncbi:MAG: helix-turn-helix domain-containing protein [Porphyrobacter sp.]|nr:helix-turn-helix domain-containing protein [Porphyrobacter sp.]
MYVDCRHCPLRQTSLFRPLEGAELDFVRAIKADQVTVAPKTAIIDESNAAADRVFTLFSGWAYRYIRIDERTRQVLDILLPGDLIALQSPITGRTRHRVESITTTSLCLLTGPGFRSLFEEHPALSEALVATLLFDESRADRRLAMVGRLRPTLRLAHFFLELQERLARRGLITGDTFEMPLTYELLADLIGASRAQVGESLRELRDRQWATLTRGRMQIIDRAPMAEACRYEPLPSPELRALI